jgi:hypothetical protein
MEEWKQISSFSQPGHKEGRKLHALAVFALGKERPVPIYRKNPSTCSVIELWLSNCTQSLITHYWLRYPHSIGKMWPFIRRSSDTSTVQLSVSFNRKSQ